MRNNGGFVLLTINKNLSLITSDDLDKSVIRDMFRTKCKKPLILHTLDGSILFQNITMSNTGFGCSYQSVDISLDEDNQVFVITAQTIVSITYSEPFDRVSFAYEYNEI